MKRIKCLYRKIVTCGVADDRTPCDKHPRGVRDVQQHIMGRSLEELKASYKFSTDKDAKPTIKWLKEWTPASAARMCSIAHNLHCNGGRCNYDYNSHYCSYCGFAWICHSEFVALCGGTKAIRLPPSKYPKYTKPRIGKNTTPSVTISTMELATENVPS